MLLVKRSSEARLFRHLSNYVFRVGNFDHRKSIRVILLFQNVENLIEISKVQQNIEKKFFVSEIIASELVSLN